MQRRITLWTSMIGMFGSLAAVVVASLTFGIGSGWEALNHENKIIPLGFNPFRDFAVICILIALLLFLASALVNWISLFGRSVSLLLITEAALQSWTLQRALSSSMPTWALEYSSLMAAVPFTVYFFLGITIILFVSNTILIWFTYRSRSYPRV